MYQAYAFVLILNLIELVAMSIVYLGVFDILKDLCSEFQEEPPEAEIFQFNSVQEWIEVCLVTITITSWLLPSNKDSAMMLDQMLYKNLPKLLQDKS